MTQEEKQLLLIDLCARLPYGVKCRQFKLDSQICTLTADLLDKVDNLEPYLRLLSSVTEEEKEEYFDVTQVNNHCAAIDYLNAHHFDYRGLIKRGLGIDCTGLNIYENEKFT